VGIPVAAGALALAITPLWGFSLYGYVFQRAATIGDTGRPSFPDHLTNPSFEASLRGWAAGGSRKVLLERTGSAAHTGTHGLRLSNSSADEDAYAFQNLMVKPKTDYAVTAWVNARGLRRPAVGGRGVLIWDAQDGLLYTAPLTSATNGWKRIAFTFPTHAKAKDIQIRLYAPEGRVVWDSVRLTARGRAAGGARATGAHVQTSAIPETSATQEMALGSSGAGNDAAGAASNAYKVAEAKALWDYIKHRPIYGYGFGKIASDFSTGYSYELSYLDLLLKAGLIGLLLYLSYPLRLVADGRRAGRRRHARGGRDGIGTAGVVAGVVVGILVAGATNPFLFAAFGLISILATVAWLERDQPNGNDAPA
jgi:hypothetical protein